jgi:hypothetical protein
MTTTTTSTLFPVVTERELAIVSPEAVTQWHGFAHQHDVDPARCAWASRNLRLEMLAAQGSVSDTLVDALLAAAGLDAIRPAFLAAFNRRWQTNLLIAQGLTDTDRLAA